jgi:hypothetical protein
MTSTLSDIWIKWSEQNQTALSKIANEGLRESSSLTKKDIHSLQMRRSPSVSITPESGEKRHRISQHSDLHRLTPDSDLAVLTSGVHLNTHFFRPLETRLRRPRTCKSQRGSLLLSHLIISVCCSDQLHLRIPLVGSLNENELVRAHLPKYTKI